MCLTIPEGSMIPEIPVLALLIIPVLSSTALNFANSKCCLTPEEFCSQASFAWIVRNLAPLFIKPLAISNLVILIIMRDKINFKKLQ